MPSERTNPPQPSDRFRAAPRARQGQDSIGDAAQTSSTRGLGVGVLEEDDGAWLRGDDGYALAHLEPLLSKLAEDLAGIRK
jgi:hypothetical protein